MDGDRERSLVAWVNTFTGSFPAGAAPSSLADFASGDVLFPIARTIVGSDDDDDSNGTTTPTAVGWAGVFFHMQLAGLIGEDERVPSQEDDERKKLAIAVTCLEELLRYTVGEDCLGRETFIRQIMSLDADVQGTLRHIIVGDQQQYQQDQSEVRSSEVGSPCRGNNDANSSSSSVRGSPGHSTPAPSGGGHRHRPRTSTSTSTSESSYEEDESDEDDLTAKSWYSPHPRGSARRQSNVRARGRTGERAAPVGPKPPRQGRTLDMDKAEQVLAVKRETTAVSAATAASSIPPDTCVMAPADGAAGWTFMAAEVRKRKERVSKTHWAHTCSSMICVQSHGIC